MYSQNYEEKWIAEYFGDFRGRFLDIGANDGKTISNTYRLALDGWAGVYVEPSPAAYAKLLQTIEGIPPAESRYDGPRFQALNIALGAHNGSITLHESGPHRLHNGNTNNVALLSTTMPSQLQRWVHETFTPVEVPCQTVGSTPEISGTFDLVSIDAEGMDWTILKQLKLDDLAVAALLIEWNGDPKERKKIEAYCERFSLKVRNENYENLFLTI